MKSKVKAPLSVCATLPYIAPVSFPNAPDAILLLLLLLLFYQKRIMDGPNAVFACPALHLHHLTLPGLSSSLIP